MEFSRIRKSQVQYVPLKITRFSYRNNKVARIIKDNKHHHLIKFKEGYSLISKLIKPSFRGIIIQDLHSANHHSTRQGIEVTTNNNNIKTFTINSSNKEEDNFSKINQLGLISQFIKPQNLRFNNNTNSLIIINCLKSFKHF